MTSTTYSSSYQFGSGEEAYPALRADVLTTGSFVESRVGPTYELENVGMMFLNPRMIAPVSRPGFSPGLGLTHAAELVLGEDLKPQILTFAPRYEEFSDGYGTYGPRAHGQLEPLLRELEKPSSRRAVLALWNSDLDAKGDDGYAHSDHPCTIALTFRVRNHRLNMSVHMRSNDIWLGWTHDIMQFAVLQMTLANCLGVAPGTYWHTADSFHMYERDRAASSPVVGVPSRLTVSGFGHFGCTLEDARNDIRAALGASSTASPVSQSARVLHESLLAKARKK